jgi:branched-chain amino acid transport system ATP-binding protein
MPILEGEKVSKNFGGLGAIANVDFYINQGEIVGLIGPNGAGKTTLFNLISGAIAPTSGALRFKDEDITHLSPHQICQRGVARTFQTSRLFSDMTVFDNVLLGVLFGKQRGMHTADAHQEAKELLKLVNLSEKEGLIASDLTLAAQKRLEIARALATKPKLLLLDETMAGLNHTEVAQSLELIKRIRNSGITIFLIEHIMKAIMSISERVIVLHHGEKIAEGTPHEIATSQTVIKIYLGK